MRIDRSAGVQLHPTSLPGGRLGAPAFEFVDWLAEAGQSWWQMLPLGPPDRHGSPYKSKSAFAAWRGLLAEPDAPVSAEELSTFLERHRYWAQHLPRPMLADQVRFAREWSALHAYAGERGVRLIGDVPIYVAAGSIDHRAWPELFKSGEVAGCPPDAYSASGQLWGNPLYDWPALQRRGYRWWIERLRRTFELFDVTRIDHFRGFVAYWAVPAGARTARGGRWRRGPGAAVFEAARRELGELPVIAEDLGDITPAVTRLRRRLGFPGMVVLQFAFSDDPLSPHQPANHTADSVTYTGTHDNETLMSWWKGLEERPRARALAAAGDLFDPSEPHWSFIRLNAASPAMLAMIQAQDVLGLGPEARMNRPGQASGNWSWRLEPGQLTAEHAVRLREVTREAGR